MLCEKWIDTIIRMECSEFRGTEDEIFILSSLTTLATSEESPSITTMKIRITMSLFIRLYLMT